MICKPSLSFLKNGSDPVLLITAEAILAGLAGNPDLPSPTPTLPVLQAAVDDFQTALANAADGGKSLTAIKNAKRAVLAQFLRQLAAYLQVACNNNFAVLVGSGFPYQKPDRQPVGVLPKPNLISLAPGARTGDLDAVINPLNGASAYNWRVMLADTPDIVLQTIQTTAASCTFSNLIPGQVYAVQANAIGAAGPSDWSTLRTQRTL